MASDQSPGRIIVPDGIEGRFIVAVPHTGKEIPEEGIVRDVLDLEKIAMLEDDRFSWEIYSPLVQYGGLVVASRFHRYVVDLNRSPNEAGEQGVLREVNFSGTKVVRRPYTEQERELVLSRYWHPYHDALQKAIDSQLQLANEQGTESVFLLAGHTMMGRGTGLHVDKGQQRADICLGTLDDKIASCKVIAAFEEVLRESARKAGMSFAKNWPYRGNGHITSHFRRQPGVEVLQVEVSQDTCVRDGAIPVVQGIIAEATMAVLDEMYRPMPSPLR